ncbi:MAG: hypothetical protein ACM3SW_21045 [Actinomycetota bacterium]
MIFFGIRLIFEDADFYASDCVNPPQFLPTRPAANLLPAGVFRV